MVLCRGQQGTSAGEETGDGSGGSDEKGAQGWVSLKDVGRRGERSEGRRKKAKDGGWHRRAGVVGVGKWSPVSGSPSTFVGGRVSVHFIFLHTV